MLLVVDLHRCLLFINQSKKMCSCILTRLLTSFCRRKGSEEMYSEKLHFYSNIMTQIVLTSFTPVSHIMLQFDASTAPFLYTNIATELQFKLIAFMRNVIYRRGHAAWQ